MKTLSKLLTSIEVIASHGLTGRQVGSVVCDSRKVRPGDLFVAIRGADHDGMHFAEQAVAHGAAAVVGERAAALRPLPAWVQVPDAREALARLACAVHEHPSQMLDVFGITGTNGKTTTATIVHEMLVQAGRRPGLLTTVEYQVGDREIPAERTTPDAPTLQSMLADMCRCGQDSAVMEVSSHALAQRRVDGMRFAGAAFTNLSRDHLDYHKTFDAYFSAKRRLFEMLADTRGVAATNLDDRWGRRLRDWLKEEGVATLTFGMERAADVRGSALQLSSRGTAFLLETPWGTQRVASRLLGRCNVANLLCAVALCGAAGVPFEALSGAIDTCRPMWGRLERMEVPAEPDVFVDYAHTDDALRNVLSTLRELTRGRLIVVFGCGGDRDRSKRPVMGQVAAELADYSIITNDNPRTELPERIAAEILAGVPAGTPHEVMLERRDAIARALALGRSGDVVLIAGKGHETYQQIGRRSIHFDDREEVRLWAKGA